MRHLADRPDEWWDNRMSKRNPRAPNFKHKATNKALWIDNVRTPNWAKVKFEATME